MRVLISAYACEPGCGSEPAIGWNVIRGLSEQHDLTVITRANNAEKIRSVHEPWVQSVKWVFLDPPSWLTFWKKGRAGVRLFYLIWQTAAYFQARALLRDRHFDVIHHLTFASILPASPLAFLGRPFVAGPLGGAQEPPKDLVADLSGRAWWAVKAQKWSRSLVAMISLAGPAYRRSCYCLGATRESLERLQLLGAPRVGLEVQSGLSHEELDLLGRSNAGRKRREGPLRVMIASRMVFWKGLDLAVEALARAKEEGVEIAVTISETGPEEGRLRRLVSQLALNDEVSFLGRLPSHDDLLGKMSECDVLLHPAFAESFGQACLEALACGLPVICFRWGGPGMIVKEGCGYPVEVGRRTEMINGLTAALHRCRGDRAAGMPRTETLQARAREFTWQRLVDSVEDAYRWASGEGKREE